MQIEVKEKDAVAVADPVIITDLKHNLPGRRRVLLSGLKFELSLSNINYVFNNYPAARWSNLEPIDRLIEAEKNKKTLAERKLNDIPAEALAFPFKTRPYEHQKRAFYLAKDADAFALLMEMGTGKSKVVCDCIAYKYTRGRVNCAVIIAPNGVHKQWHNDQIPTHLPEIMPHVSFCYQSNQNKKYKDAFENFMAAPPDILKIFCVNIEALSGGKGIDALERVLSSFDSLMVVDESVRIKSPGAARTRNVLRLGGLARERMILSGAPITQGIEDLYAQFKFLNEDILGFSSFWSFKDHFCIEKPIPGAHVAARKIVGYKNVNQIQDAVDPYSFRVTKNDCLDLPDKIYMTRNVELTAEQAKAYKELRDNLMTELESGEFIAAPIAAVKLMKLQQIICGFVIAETGDEPTPLKSNRAAAVIDLINEASGKVIVWCRFKYDIKNLFSLCQAAGFDPVMYYGDIDQAERVDAIKKFKTDPKCKVFIANPAAAGTGLNLAEANTAIYYSNDFNADYRWQSEDRIHRIGQTNHCTYIDLVAPGTIDAKIVDALRRKKTVADSVLDIKELIAQL